MARPLPNEHEVGRGLKGIGVDASDLTNLVPIGTVTGMLVIIMVAFIKDSARQDERVDKTAHQLVDAARVELEASRIREEKLQGALIESKKQCEERLQRLEIELRESKKFLYSRIQHLEKMLYGRPVTQDESASEGGQ